MRLTAVILAGGRSSRMGREKALLPVAGHATAIARQLALTRSVFPIEMLASCRPEQRLPLPRAVRRIHDDGTQGPLAGIAAALAAMRGNALLVLGVDLVRLPPVVLRRIVGAASPDGSVGAIPFRNGRAEPLACVLPSRAASYAAAQLTGADLSLQYLSRTLVSSNLARWYFVPVHEAPAFANWNHRADRIPPWRGNA